MTLEYPNAVAHQNRTRITAANYLTIPEDPVRVLRGLTAVHNLRVMTNGGILARTFRQKDTETRRALLELGLRMPTAFGCILRYLIRCGSGCRRLQTKAQTPKPTTQAPGFGPHSHLLLLFRTGDGPCGPKKLPLFSLSLFQKRETGKRGSSALVVVLPGPRSWFSIHPGGWFPFHPRSLLSFLLLLSLLFLLSCTDDGLARPKKEVWAPIVPIIEAMRRPQSTSVIGIHMRTSDSFAW